MTSLEDHERRIAELERKITNLAANVEIFMRHTHEFIDDDDEPSET